jgi:hypothetical protein
MRIFNNPILNKPFGIRVDNEKDASNEELADKVIKASPKEIYDYKNRLKDEELELIKFLEEKTENDTHGISDDVTEEDLDQAIFEASFNKLNFEEEEIKSIYY